MPERPWVQGQTWDDLLFAHWRVSVDVLGALLPEPFGPDRFEGSGWLGVTPFRVTGFRLRGLLPLPLVSSFLEVNVRTYVTVDDRPGIYFFSLDAESPLAVEAARYVYHLPYHRAAMSAARRGSWLDYSSRRRDSAPTRPHDLELSYRGVGEARPAEPGSLEHFLAERYCLYTLDERGRPARADVHHLPWLLQRAETEIRENSMAPDGVTLAGEPLLHFSVRQDVVIWPLESLQTPG